MNAKGQAPDDETPAYFVMPVEQRSGAILLGLSEAQVEFLVVGAMAGVLQGLSSSRAGLDIVHRRTPENVARLLAWLLAHDGHDHVGLPYRRLRPTEDTLLGSDDVLLQTDLGKLNLRHVSWSGGYEGMLPDTALIDRDQLEHLIAANAHAGPVEDRAVLPVMIIALDRIQVNTR